MAMAVWAAGSLKQAVMRWADLCAARGEMRPAMRFGASGLLRKGIEGGEPVAAFVSADMRHPTRVAALPGWSPARPVLRNRLCLLVRPGLQVASTDALAVMLEPTLRLGMSTPVSDPSGDYALQVFERAELQRPGSAMTLRLKALRLTGSEQAPKPPVGRGTYEWLVADGHADLFLTYESNAMAACLVNPALTWVALPPALQVEADYGMTRRRDAPEQVTEFLAGLFGPDMHEYWTSLGFELLADSKEGKNDEPHVR